MTRKLEVRNILCFDGLALEIPTGATLITGPNSSGKTSVARIIAALASHDANPAGLAATQHKAYLRDGAPEGFASLSDGATWRPPKMEVPPGAAPEATPHAVGLRDFLVKGKRSAKDRAKVYEDLYLPENPQEILEPLWKGTPQQLAHVLKLIEEHDGDWDPAAAIYEAQGKQAKSKWCEITGRQRWGSKIGAEYRPDDFEQDLEGESEDNLRAEITNAGDELRAVGAQQAVEAHEIEQARIKRDEELPEARDELLKFTQSRTIIKGRIDEVSAEIRRINDESEPLVNRGHEISNEITRLKREMEQEDNRLPLICPHCKGELSLNMESGDLLPFEERPAPDHSTKIETLKTEYEELRGKVGTLSADKKTQEAVGSELQQDLNQVDAAIQRQNGVIALLEKESALADKEPSAGSEAERAKWENVLERSKARFKSWQTYTEALRTHENIIEIEEIRTLLGPTGARAKFMQGRMDVLRNKLLAIHTIAKWLPIDITSQYEPTSNGRAAVLAAENEQRKVQWSVQMAVALLDEDTHWVVLDAADLLRGDSWDGLVAVINKLTEKRPDLHVVVCATESDAPEGWHTIEME